jgi:cytochrome c5
MNKIVFPVVVLIIILLSECKTSSTASRSVSSPAVVSESKPVESNAASLAIATGQNLYNSKCVDCHKLPVLTDYTKSEWADIMIKMSRKAHLSDTETNHVLAYINTGAKI